MFRLEKITKSIYLHSTWSSILKNLRNQLIIRSNERVQKRYRTQDQLLKNCVSIHCTKSLQSCLTLCDPMNYSPPGSSVHGDFPGKNTRVGCQALLQRIFLNQGWNLHLLRLLNWQAGSLPFVPPGKPLSVPCCCC